MLYLEPTTMATKLVIAILVACVILARQRTLLVLTLRHEQQRLSVNSEYSLSCEQLMIFRCGYELLVIKSNEKRHIF